MSLLGVRRSRTTKTGVWGVKNTTVPKISEETKNRLMEEALTRPAFEGMDREEIGAWIDERVAAKFPWWYGHLEIDKPKKAATPAQLASIANARKRKVENKAPYVPETVAV